MTNSSPQEPQNTNQDQDRPTGVAGLTFDELIAIFVAFTTIGAILFWVLGGRKDGFANTFGWNRQYNVFTTDATTATGFGLDNYTVRENGFDRRLSAREAEDLRLANRLRQEKEAVIVVPPTADLNLSPQVTQQPYELDSGTKIIPLTEPDAQPNLGDGDQLDTGIKEGAKPQIIESPDPKPQAKTPEPETKTKIIERVEIPDDIPPTYWAYPFVDQMSKQNLVGELTNDQDFNPDQLITRASMAAFISQAFDMKPETEPIKPFNDVTNQNKTAADIDKAVRLGFMEGYSNNEFRPLENIPRYQVLVTLATGLGLTPSQDVEQTLQKFDDGTNIPDWARQQVAAAAEAGLVVNRPGFNATSLNPNEPATRAEVVGMIHQALVKTGKLKAVESEYIVKP
ncbi:S-layer domain-containing protein [Chondrocystis sp. NIES-4102]|nr:S-layer domain-containing protein [Chondrocystis sp. NIES-4102]